MIGDQRLAVVVPTFNEANQIRRVVDTMPDFVDLIIIVDDCSSDGTSLAVASLDDVRVLPIRHERNRGVGAAIETGYREAIERSCDLIAVMAGDGQMPADELAGLVSLVAAGKADYAKANRLAKVAAWRLVPPVRLLGNLGLSLGTQLASGYWGTWDSQSGYTVINRRAAKELVRLGIYPRYGCPNDILIKLGARRFRVVNVPSRPVYGVGEVSKLRVRKAMVTIPGILAKGFAWRLGDRYWSRGEPIIPALFAASAAVAVLALLNRTRRMAALAAGLGVSATVMDAALTRRGLDDEGSPGDAFE